MLQDKDTHKIGFEISNTTLLLIIAILTMIALGILSLSALGSASLMF